jgi:hypothetical protein
MLLILKNGMRKQTVCLSEKKYIRPEDLTSFLLDDFVEYVGPLPKYVF